MDGLLLHKASTVEVSQCIFILHNIQTRPQSKKSCKTKMDIVCLPIKLCVCDKIKAATKLHFFRTQSLTNDAMDDWALLAQF